MQQTRNIRTKAKLVIGVIGLVILFSVLASCAPQQNDNPTPSSREENTETSSEGNDIHSMAMEFSMDDDCSACHKKPMESEQNDATVAAVHAQQEDMECITCHNQEKELTEVHSSATSLEEPMRLKTAKISEEICLGCHGGYEELSEKTAEITLLTDANGLIVNPHSAKYLNAEHEEDITCMKCHTEHTEKDSNKSQSYCMNCHHMKVYECNTCHEYHS